MKWTKNLVLFLFLLCVFCFGCTRKVDQKALVQIAIPNSSHSQNISEFLHAEPMSMQSVSVQSSDGDGPNWNMQLDPVTIADVNCYLIAIGGPEGDMRRNTCVTTTGQNLYVGRWAGGIPAGGLLSLEVPSGPQREITVVGFRSQNGSCRNFRSSDIDGSNISEPVILGKVVQDLQAGPVSVTVPVTVNANSLKIGDCQGPDFNMETSQGLYFGDGSSGDYTVSSTMDLTTIGAPNQRTTYARITGYTSFVPAEPDMSVQVNSSASFAAGDEVFIHVVGSRGRMGSAADNNYDGCGYRAWQGRYTFGKITSVPDGIHLRIAKGTFLDKAWQDVDADGILFSAADLAAANVFMNGAPTNTNFCYIQVVRVPQFNNLTINGSSTLKVPTFDYASGGGVMVFRVKNLLTLNSGSSIDVSTTGFNGIAGVDGDGIGGRALSCPGTPGVTRTGGKCSGSSEGSGGGGHGNQAQSPYDGPFGPSGGGGGHDTMSPTPFGGNGAGEDCGDGSCFGTLDYKIFMGGAGGSSATYTLPGGFGGGIIYVAANSVSATGTGIYMKASGAPANSNYQAGGGAGGSVFFSYKTTNSTTNPSIIAAGGGGFVGDSTHHYGGGGGGGGRIHVLACKDATGNSQLPTNLNVSEGPGGTGYAGTVNAENGLPGSIVTIDANCQ